ncbi:hypothetical protein M427DRAFT_58878 [Gonapodya prolifera JEL478]|uniref:PB1 domain-containing protein n=1 Tax=Gonapodya prolifera (strain JEL478) TaxID=1344416 RepID=A0A139A8P5_GONPJ|nr:hypothetical protein M427DRAFT_58878 [Gonapodya prolifera JEL478]|eukprot:KXS13162.1 hypothetical protein M427DRAFT_58878 [Gonapodya prolifera JEL478]
MSKKLRVHYWDGIKIIALRDSFPETYDSFVHLLLVRIPAVARTAATYVVRLQYQDKSGQSVVLEDDNDLVTMWGESGDTVEVMLELREASIATRNLLWPEHRIKSFQPRFFTTSSTLPSAPPPKEPPAEAPPPISLNPHQLSSELSLRAVLGQNQNWSAEGMSQLANKLSVLAMQRSNSERRTLTSSRTDPCIAGQLSSGSTAVSRRPSMSTLTSPVSVSSGSSQIGSSFPSPNITLFSDGASHMSDLDAFSLHSGTSSQRYGSESMLNASYAPSHSRQNSYEGQYRLDHSRQASLNGDMSSYVSAASRQSSLDVQRFPHSHSRQPSIHESSNSSIPSSDNGEASTHFKIRIFDQEHHFPLSWRNSASSSPQELMGVLAKPEWATQRYLGYKLTKTDTNRLLLSYAPRKSSLRAAFKSDTQFSFTIIFERPHLFQVAVRSYPPKLDSLNFSDFQKQLVLSLTQASSTGTANDSLRALSTDWAFLSPPTEIVTANAKGGVMYHCVFLVKDSRSKNLSTECTLRLQSYLKAIMIDGEWTRDWAKRR